VRSWLSSKIATPIKRMYEDQYRSRRCNFANTLNLEERSLCAGGPTWIRSRIHIFYMSTASNCGKSDQVAPFKEPSSGILTPPNSPRIEHQHWASFCSLQRSCGKVLCLEIVGHSHSIFCFVSHLNKLAPVWSEDGKCLLVRSYIFSNPNFRSPVLWSRV
jgi:hypothetical protein